jgi:hypothetical protein
MSATETATTPTAPTITINREYTPDPVRCALALLVVLGTDTTHADRATRGASPRVAAPVIASSDQQ